MTAKLTALRREHSRLLPRIEQIKSAAQLIEGVSPEALSASIEQTFKFLTEELMPHAKAEEDVLYRAYDQVANSPWATDTMRRDHESIERLIDELRWQKRLHLNGELRAEQQQELRRILYGLYSLIKQHLSHEEDLILPRIEASISQEAADQLMESVESAAAGYRG